MPANEASQPAGIGPWPQSVAGLAGAWLGLSLLKFGNPVILDQMIDPPNDFWEFVFSPWPVSWGYWMLAGLVIAGATIVQFRIAGPRSLVALPLVWFAWQLAAATRTVDARLTHATLLHFAACVASFYLGLFALSRVRQLRWFWIALLSAFIWVLWMGSGQHFGGLETTQQMVYQQPNWQQFPPEYLKRIASRRIFSTLVYPNALAGAILLLLPVLLAALLVLTERLGNIVRGVLVGFLGYAALACLYWSGSKSGWLIALALGLVALGRLPLQRHVKVAIIGVAVIVGLIGFSVKFSDYFRRGATSVGARLDYWQAACRIARTYPVFGTGPGTFSVPYKNLKAPEAEMTRLVHNNYLEQASDSGLVGFLTFCAFMFGSLAVLYRKSVADPVRFSLWLGLLGWVLQGFVEFGLYIPALAWPAFLFFGWLWGVGPNGFDNPTMAQYPFGRR